MDAFYEIFIFILLKKLWHRFDDACVYSAIWAVTCVFRSFFLMELSFIDLQFLLCRLTQDSHEFDVTLRYSWTDVVHMISCALQAVYVTASGVWELHIFTLHI